MKIIVFYCKSDTHVQPMRFSILCTPTDNSDKTQMMCSTIYMAVFVYSQIPYSWNQAELQYRVQQQT